MGAWGYGPYDNDSALDWLSYLEHDAVKRIKRGLADEEFYIVHAAAALLLELERSEHFGTNLLATMAAEMTGAESPVVKRTGFTLSFYFDGLVDQAIEAMEKGIKEFKDTCRDEKEAHQVWAETVRLLRERKQARAGEAK